MVEVKYGNGKTEYGPGVLITFDANDICRFIISALEERYGITIGGPRTIKIGGELIQGDGSIYVDSSGSAVCGDLLYSGRGPSGGDADLDRKEVLKELKKLPIEVKVDEPWLTPAEIKVELNKTMDEAVARVRKLWDRLGFETKADIQEWMEKKPRAAWERAGDLKLDNVMEVPPKDLPPRSHRVTIKERIARNGLRILSNDQLEAGLCELMGWTDIRFEEWEEEGRGRRGLRGLFNGCRQELPNYVLGDTAESNFTAAYNVLVKGSNDKVRLLDALFQILGADNPVPREQLMLRNAGIKDCSMALLLMKRPELFQP